MKELKDIVLKKGDIVYYISSYGSKLILCVDVYDGSSVKEFEKGGSVITKIERPTQYKTIYETPKQILDQKEKEYLEAVIRPFRDRVKYVKKVVCNNDAYISIGVDLNGIDTAMLPYFEKDTMYKGMKPNKEYTLDELGLFKE